MAKFIALYGMFALLASVIAGVFAYTKRRDASFWAAWTLLFPPMLLMLLLMSKNSGERPKRPPLDADDGREF